MKHENFNDAEALKIAINIEEEGLAFYSILMKNAKDEKVKEIFSRLASAEKKHLSIFQKAYAEITSPASTVQGCEDYTVDLYLKYLADTGIFTKKGEARRFASEITTDVEALNIGIQAEKDSILYYTEAAKNTKYPAGKTAFEQLANEEKKHLKLLAKQLKALKKPVS
ncbi:MAG TPA: ferritin family protein [Candidatus Brocadiaceae bacterium]|nr:ferritin family protein [Candidatus Brocadiaceae bacterium]